MNNKYQLSDDRSCYRIFFLDGSFFIIDAADFSAVSEYTWFYGKRGYPTAHLSRKSKDGYRTIPLHRYLLHPEDGCDVDHISGDKLDNRRCNLRVCTHQENMFNQKLRNTNTTGYYGVSRMKSTGRFEAYVHHDGKKVYLGTYATAEEAAAVRDKAALQLFGPFARLNRDLEEKTICVS